MQYIYIILHNTMTNIMTRSDIIQCWLFGCSIGNTCWSIMFDAIACHGTHTTIVRMSAMMWDVWGTQWLYFGPATGDVFSLQGGTEWLSAYFPRNGMHSTRPWGVLKYPVIDFPASSCLLLAVFKFWLTNPSRYWPIRIYLKAMSIFRRQKLEQL